MSVAVSPAATETAPPGPECATRLAAVLKEERARRERVDDVVRFLRTVPLEGSLRFGYRILFEGAVATIPREYRRLLGLRRSWLPAVTATRLVLFVAQRALGTGPRAHDMARRRLRRLDSAECQRPAS